MMPVCNARLPERVTGLKSLCELSQERQNPFAFAKTGTTVLLSEIVPSQHRIPASSRTLRERHSCTAFRQLTAIGGESLTPVAGWSSSARSFRARSGSIVRKICGRANRHWAPSLAASLTIDSGHLRRLWAVTMPVPGSPIHDDVAWMRTGCESEKKLNLRTKQQPRVADAVVGSRLVGRRMIDPRDVERESQILLPLEVEAVEAPRVL